MFADNTIIILRNQEEANTVIKLLNIYNKVLDFKTNLSKFFLFLIKGTQILISDIRVILSKVYYVYLRILIEKTITDYLKIF